MGRRALALTFVICGLVPLASCGQARPAANAAGHRTFAAGVASTPAESGPSYDTNTTPSAFAEPVVSDTPSPTPACTMTAATQRRALMTGGTLTGASVAPAAALANVYARSTIDRTEYMIQLVASDGHVVASVKANNRSQITGTCGNDVSPNQVFPSMPLISTSAGRVYHQSG